MQCGLTEIEPRMKLATALRVCFTGDDVWTVSALRTEIRKGTLQCERVAGKIVVTKTAIREMLVKCRDQQKGQGSISEDVQAATESGLSETDQARLAQDAALATVQALKKRSANTSPKNTSRRKPTDGLKLVSSQT